MKKVGLIDRGFERSYSESEINGLLDVFTNPDDLLDFVYGIHTKDKVYDLKRGEYYPEILRCIISLKRTLSLVYDIEPEQCHPNFGSNGSIDSIVLGVKLREVRNNIASNSGGVVAPTPTYFRNYNSVNSKDLRFIGVPLNHETWNVNVDEFINTIRNEEPSLVMLVSPNNPTGIPITDENLFNIIDSISSNTLVMLDRTLVNIESEISTKTLLKKYKSKQLVILHSLSKYHNLSHLRIGFALYSNMEVAKEFQALLPLGLGIEGAIRAISYLSSEGVLKPSNKIVNQIKVNRELLADFCNKNREFRITDFSGNYALLFLPESISAEYVVEKLISKGVYVMGGYDFPVAMENVIRVHTGGEPSMVEKLISELSMIRLK